VLFSLISPIFLLSIAPSHGSEVSKEAAEKVEAAAEVEKEEEKVAEADTTTAPMKTASSSDDSEEEKAEKEEELLGGQAQLRLPGSPRLHRPAQELAPLWAG
jgi:hypothetical protein